MRSTERSEGLDVVSTVLNEGKEIMLSGSLNFVYGGVIIAEEEEGQGGMLLVISGIIMTSRHPKKDRVMPVISRTIPKSTQIPAVVEVVPLNFVPSAEQAEKKRKTN
ncbi:hypothetical protein LR48_Vigan03g118000 [Vigna angularis]|uniref:Uncharacterized protein n=1 Tax=Phaseolus angularis TaxID=3914 RepID=A0A0L9U4Q0_PHAAN|nr:hypothetical protein LR48_Vigan03g118000 [Vigna angularis]